MRDMLGGKTDKVFMTGVKWPTEVEKFKRDALWYEGFQFF